jgi:Fe-S-cluster containining protein
MGTGCLRCGKCCTSFGVCITPFDAAAIAKATNKEPESFVSLVLEPPERERTEPSILIEGERCLLVLKRSKANVCIFYGVKGGGCINYDCRPMLCRTYPFRVSNKASELAGMKSRACPELWVPGKGEKKRYLRDCKEYEREIAAYSKIAGEWNARGGGSLKQFLEFALAKAARARAPKPRAAKGHKERLNNFSVA